MVTNNRQGEVLAMLDLGVEVVSSTLRQPEPTLKVRSVERVATREGGRERRGGDSLLISEWGVVIFLFGGYPLQFSKIKLLI